MTKMVRSVLTVERPVNFETGAPGGTMAPMNTKDQLLRHAAPTDLIRFPWVFVAVLLFAVLAWMLYTPASASSPGVIMGWLDTLFGWLPGVSSPSDPGFDKIAHATGFAAVTAAGLLTRIKPTWVIAFNVLHAGISELIQWQFIPGRQGDVLDAGVDIAGILVAWMLVAFFDRREEPQS